MVIMVVGVNGTGKTTSAAKLAKLYKDLGNDVTLVAADTYRAAAVEQLRIWSNRANTRLVCNEKATEPSAVLFDGLTSALSNNSDIVIVDTAGRLHTYDNLMSELEKMHRISTKRFPQFIVKNIITIDSLLGQNSIVQAEQFNNHVPLDGAILTKLDGTAKGGIVFSLYKKLKIPVQYIGVGEELSDLEMFDPMKYVDGLFGIKNVK
jgi:fused signal recognition particle receptor